MSSLNFIVFKISQLPKQPFYDILDTLHQFNKIEIDITDHRELFRGNMEIIYFSPKLQIMISLNVFIINNMATFEKKALYVSNFEVSLLI